MNRERAIEEFMLTVEAHRVTEAQMLERIKMMTDKPSKKKQERKSAVRAAVLADRHKKFLKDYNKAS